MCEDLGAGTPMFLKRSQVIFDRIIDGSLCSPFKFTFSTPLYFLPPEKLLKDTLNDFLAEYLEVFPLKRNPIFSTVSETSVLRNIKRAGYSWLDSSFPGNNI
jgi:hypothetical protein